MSVAHQATSGNRQRGSVAVVASASIHWLSRALGDGDSPSSSRLIAVPSLLATYMVPLAVWATLSVRARAMLDIPVGVLGFVGTVSGPLLTFMHWNKREETRQP